MISETMFIIWFVLIALIGFFVGRQYEYHWIMRRFEELIKDGKAVDPRCGNCMEYNGTYCTKYWNNMDDCYLVKERDSKEPEDPACDDWVYDEDAEEE